MVMKAIKRWTEKLIGTTRVSYDAEPEVETEEYVEVSPAKEKYSSKKIIKYFVLDNYDDIKTILDQIREGNTIIFANIRALKSKDITELKRAIAKIKKTCEAVGGDVVGIEENFILIHPEDVVVSKEDIE